MTTPSPKLGLALPTQTDTFSTDDIRNNWSKIDAAPGVAICTSTTRPSGWTSAQAGRMILETDTGLQWRWDGTGWNRMAASGLLKTSGGAWAIGERTTDFTTSSVNPVKAVSITNVVVPAGRRPIRTDIAYHAASNTTASFAGLILRSNTNNSGPVQARWRIQSGVNQAIGGTFFSIERTGLPAGVYDFSFQVNAPTGSTTVQADVNTPISIFITEL